jgi:hypothetical protein
MNHQQRKELYPTISINSKERCEKRWEDCANAYGDISAEWHISIGNGKRLRRRWIKCGGFTYICDYYGRERAICNDNYLHLSPPKGLKRHDALRYDSEFQPDDDPEFYYSHQRTSY